MDTEILNQLIIIKWLLVALITLLSIICLTVVIGSILNNKVLSSNMDLRMRDSLMAEAQMHESRGDNKKFLDTAVQLIDLYPSDVNALWYYALANYKNNHLGTALSAFGELKQLDAAWCSDIVDDYIKTVKSEMSGPKIV